MKYEVQYQVADQVIAVKLEKTGDRFHVTVGGNEYQVQAKQTNDGWLLLEMADQRSQLYVGSSSDKDYVWLDGHSWILHKAKVEKRGGAQTAVPQQAATGRLTATMPGLVRDVLIKEGDIVTRGTPLVLLEAMKMELRITAGHAGTVSKIYCTPGQVVERGEVLVEISE
jgi:3-methylcrotonyl-CoA carboxylase alpha subunit